MDRRSFLTTAAAAAATAATAAATSTKAAAAGDWGNLRHYPDPDVIALDPRFAFNVNTGAIERLATGCRWCEGPVYFRDLRCLVWSDIPNNRMMRWSEDDGHVSVFRQPSNYANGNTRDNLGRLVTCEHDTRRITRTEYDGSITVIADKYQGKPFNSPNDVVVGSDGAIWFTDPGYGILGNYESGAKRPFELPTNVYRVDPRSGHIAVVAGDFDRPNGLAFSPDEKLLYIVDSGKTRTFACSMSAAKSSPAAKCSRKARAARPMACAPTSPAMCGARRAGAIRRKMACAATRPTAR